MPVTGEPEENIFNHSGQDTIEGTPALHSWCYLLARHHKLLHGRRTVVPVDVARRTKIDYAQVDHFLNFITSAHVVQDFLPFGEKC